MKKNRDVLKDKLKVPYDVGLKESHSRRSSAARNPGFYLSLYKESPSDENYEILIKSIETWLKYSEALQREVTRDGTHLGKDFLAPYYLYPSVYLVSEALQELAKDKRFNKSKFNNYKIKVIDRMALSFDKKGLILPMGTNNSSLYNSSETYSTPLVGISLINLVGDSCKKN